MNKKKKELVEKILKMENNKFYKLNSYIDLVDGITVPLPGSMWKLIMYRDVNEYFKRQEKVSSTQGGIKEKV